MRSALGLFSENTDVGCSLRRWNMLRWTLGKERALAL